MINHAEIPGMIRVLENLNLESASLVLKEPDPFYGHGLMSSPYNRLRYPNGEEAPCGCLVWAKNESGDYQDGVGDLNAVGNWPEEWAAKYRATVTLVEQRDVMVAFLRYLEELSLDELRAIQRRKP